MKSILIAVLFMLPGIVSTANAQQAKAYETVKYVAKYNGTVFRLNYADGYPEATEISMARPNHKRLLLAPVTGQPEANGRFTLCSESGSPKIELLNIDFETLAPATIKAVYYNSNKKFPLIFKQTR